MSYFDSAAYEKLLRKVKASEEAEADLEIIRSVGNDFLAYVQVVCDGENRLNTAQNADREMIGDYDASRHIAHEKAISSASMLNRLAAIYGSEPVYQGSRTERHQVAAFCLELVSFLFENRRRVL